MKTEDQIHGYIQQCWASIDLIRSNPDLKYPEIQINEYKHVIAALYWVLDDPAYDVSDVFTTR